MNSNPTEIVVGDDHDLLIYNGPEVPAFFFPKATVLAIGADPDPLWPDIAITARTALLILQAILPQITNVRNIGRPPPGFDDVAAFRVTTTFGCTFGFINADEAIDLADWAGRHKIHCLVTSAGSVFTPLARRQSWYRSGEFIRQWEKLNAPYSGQHALDLDEGWSRGRLALRKLLSDLRTQTPRRG